MNIGSGIAIVTDLHASSQHLQVTDNTVHSNGPQVHCSKSFRTLNITGGKVGCYEKLIQGCNTKEYTLHNQSINQSINIYHKFQTKVLHHP